MSCCWSRSGTGVGPVLDYGVDWGLCPSLGLGLDPGLDLGLGLGPGLELELKGRNLGTETSFSLEGEGDRRGNNGGT